MYSQVTTNGAPALTQHCGSCSPSPAALHPMFSLSQQESHYRQLPVYEDVAYPSPSSNLCSRLYMRASFIQMIKWKWGLLESLYACILSCFSRVRLSATPWIAAHQASLPGLGGWAALEIQHVLYCYIPAHSELSKGRQYNDPPQWGEGSRFLEIPSLSWISEAEGVFGLARSQHACVCPSPPPALHTIVIIWVVNIFFVRGVRESRGLLSSHFRANETSSMLVSRT